MHERDELYQESGLQCHAPAAALSHGESISSGTRVAATGTTAERVPGVDSTRRPSGNSSDQPVSVPGAPEGVVHARAPVAVVHAAERLTPAEVRRRCQEVLQVLIAPPCDGLGGYLVWVQFMHPGVPAMVWRCLTHEDGAPLRFPDALKAHEKAVNCRMRPAQVSVRWPPRAR